MKKIVQALGIASYRSSSIALLLLSFLLTPWALIGCGQPSFSGSAPPAATLDTSVSDADKQQTQQILGRFVDDANRGDKAAMGQMMSPALLTSAAPTSAQWKQGGIFAPFLGSRDWQSDLTQSTAHGQKLVVHAHFTGSDSNTYRTNFTFKKTGSDWKIDSVLPPTKPVHPMSGSSAPKPAPGT